MAYNFLNVPLTRIKSFLHAVFSTADGHDHDGVNSKKAIMYHPVIYSIEDLGAGADIADRVVSVVPTGYTWEVVDAKIINSTANEPAGIDDDNKCTVVLKNGTNAIFSKEFNTGTAFPAAGASAGTTLVSNYVSVAAGSSIKVSVTNGTAANPPAFSIQVTYKVTVA